MEENLYKALCRLQADCARREYCTSEITARALKLSDGDAEAAMTLVSSLVQDGFVDDARYAAAFAREKSALTGWGPHKISNALRIKGIGRDTIESALREIDTQKATQKLRKLLVSKWQSLRDDPYGKFKLLRYALGRGHEYEQVRRLVEEITDDALQDGI